MYYINTGVLVSANGESPRGYCTDSLDTVCTSTPPDPIPDGEWIYVKNTTETDDYFKAQFVHGLGFVNLQEHVPPVVNNAPTATAVTFTGTLQVGQTLTGAYTYADDDSDAESGTTFQWYQWDGTSPLNLVPISGASSQTYVLTALDEGKYISFEK